jgi:hypothetical protein
LLVFLVAFGLTAGYAGAGSGKDPGRDSGRLPSVAAKTAIPLDVIFQEGFNGATFPPDGWTMRNMDGNDPGTTDPSDSAWYQSASVGGQNTKPPYEGEAFAAAYYGTANEYLLDDWLISPNTGDTAPAGAADTLTFWVTARLSASGDYADSLMILVSTTDTDPSSFTELLYIQASKTDWVQYAVPLPTTATRYIAFRYYITDGGPDGTYSDKVCLDDVQINRTITTGVTDLGGAPGSYALLQNYPNPFNPATTIRFDMAKAGPVTLTVHNVLGEEVARPVEGSYAPGSYGVSFSAANLPSGVYYYSLRTAEFTQTRRMMLVK